MIIEFDPEASLEGRAQAARSRLFDAIDVLDRRRHELARVGNRAKSMVVPIGLGAVGILVMGATTAFVAQQRAIKRAKNDWRNVAVRRLLPRPPPPSFLSEAGRRAGVALVLLSVTELAKRILRSI